MPIITENEISRRKVQPQIDDLLDQRRCLMKVPQDDKIKEKVAEIDLKLKDLSNQLYRRRKYVESKC
jgi:hypothetical protein